MRHPDSCGRQALRGYCTTRQDLIYTTSAWSRRKKFRMNLQGLKKVTDSCWQAGLMCAQMEHTRPTWLCCWHLREHASATLLTTTSFPGTLSAPRKPQCNKATADGDMHTTWMLSTVQDCCLPTREATYPRGPFLCLLTTDSLIQHHYCTPARWRAQQTGTRTKPLWHEIVRRKGHTMHQQL
jgi:hypothetical protein